MAGDGNHDIAVIAKLLMLDPRRIRQLAAEGWIPKPERARYSLIGAVQGYIKFLKGSLKGGPRGNEHSRLLAAQASRIEMENLKRSGELQVISQVEQSQRGLVVMLRSTLEGMPGRLASELANQDAPVLYQRLQTECRAVENQCADYLEKRADTLAAMPPPREDAEALDEDDTDAMGGEEPHNVPGQP